MCAQILVILVVGLVVDGLEGVYLLRQAGDLTLHPLLVRLGGAGRGAGKYVQDVAVIVPVNDIVLIEGPVLDVLLQQDVVLRGPVHRGPVSVLVLVPVVIDVGQNTVLERIPHALPLVVDHRGAELPHRVLVSADDAFDPVDFKRGCAVGDGQVVIPVFVLLQKQIPVPGDFTRQNLRKKLPDLHVADQLKLVLQVLKAVARPAGAKFPVPLDLVSQVIRDAGESVVHYLRHLQVVIALGGDVTDRVGGQGGVHMALSIVAGVLLQNLVQHHAGVLLAAADAAAEGHHIAGGVQLVVLLPVVQLGLLHQEVLLGDHRLHMDVHADTVSGGLCNIDVQLFHGLGHQVGGVQLCGVDLLPVGGVALLGPGAGVLDHRNGGVLLNIELGNQKKGDARQHRHTSDDGPVFFQIAKYIQFFHAGASSRSISSRFPLRPPGRLFRYS